MSTFEGDGSVTQPAATSPARAPAPADKFRATADLAALLLCVTAGLTPLMSAESPGTVFLRVCLFGAATLTVVHDLALRRPWRPSVALLGALLAWIAGVLVASFGGSHAAGLDLMLVHWSCFALAAAAAHRLTGDRCRRQLLLAALICGAVLLTVYGFEEAWLERPVRIDEFDHDPALQSAAAADIRSLSGQERFFNPRIAGGFVSANLMGAAYGLGALLAAGAAWRLWRAARPKSAIVTATAGCLMLCALWITGSKGALVGLAVGGGVAVAATVSLAAGDKTPAARWRRRLPALAIGLALGGMLLLPAVTAFIPETHAPDFNLAGQPTGALKSAWVRLDYWQTGWRMWRAHPVGIGPDQTQQVFSQFRSPWALETPIDLHHEAFEMLVECGPLAALGMLAVFGWILTVGLRRLHEDAAGQAAASAAGAAPTALPPNLFLPLPLMVAFGLIGGWLVGATLGFFDLNRQLELPLLFTDLSSPWTGLRLSFLGCVVIALSACCWALARSGRSSTTDPVPRGVLLAALTALLAHSGFDFVLQNQALLIWAGLLTGLLTADTAAAPAGETAPATPAPAPPPSARERLRRRLPAVALMFCALVLGWLGVVQPLRLALARVAADHAQRDFEQVSLLQSIAAVQPDQQAAFQQALAEAGPALIAARRQVLELAPEDHEAVLQYHGAIANLQRLTQAGGLPPPTIAGLGGVPRTPAEELRTLAAAYTAGNPLDPARWYYVGRLDLSLGDLQNRANLKQAEAAFLTAAALDTQRPLSHLMVGDCRLAQGDRAGAAQAYAAAWQAQALTSVPEVQFFCLYYDPNAEILPPGETGMDQAIVDLPSLLLHDLGTVPPADRAALLRRYWIALRTVQITAPALPPMADPQNPTQAEKTAAGRRLSWALREKKTLDDLLALRPGSLDTQLLLTLRQIALTPTADRRDADLAARFDALKKAAAGSPADPLMPGTLERLESLVRFPPRMRYTATPAE